MSDWWRETKFPDGTEQLWNRFDGYPPRIFIERVVGAKSRRKNWCVVSRNPPDQHKNTKYPPKISGPHRTLDAAKAAYLIYIATLKP